MNKSSSGKQLQLRNSWYYLDNIRHKEAIFFKQADGSLKPKEI